MTHDPDILAIRRQRRQAGRCLHCARRTPRAALCRECRQTRRYCPRCECIYQPEDTRLDPQNRCTKYCRPCGNITRNGPRVPLSVYRAELATRVHPLLPAIIRLYRQRLSYSQIARQLAIKLGTLNSIMSHARRTGRWPTTLRRDR